MLLFTSFCECLAVCKLKKDWNPHTLYPFSSHTPPLTCVTAVPFVLKFSFFAHCWGSQAHGLCLAASAVLWPVLLSCSMAGGMLCPMHLSSGPSPWLPPLVCRSKHVCISVGLQLLLLSVPIQLCCLECSSPSFQQTQVAFTVPHTSCQGLLFLWVEAVAAVAGRVPFLVALTCQGCSELTRWLSACWVCDTQLQSSGLPGCHPVPNSKLTQEGMRCMGRKELIPSKFVTRSLLKMHYSLLW